MKAVTKITLTDDSGIKFFGEGPWRLLRCVEKTGSLRAAAMPLPEFANEHISVWLS